MQRDNLGLFSVRENKRASGRLDARLPSAWYGNGNQLTALHPLQTHHDAGVSFFDVAQQ